MSKTYEFLEQCNYFFVTTVNGTAPASRPFGAVMEYEEILYFSTANTKEVYSQLVANPSIQIVAIKPGTRDWIRINGKAIEINDLNMKQAMLNACPALLKRFSSKDCKNFALFKVLQMKSSLHTDSGITSLN